MGNSSVVDAPGRIMNLANFLIVKYKYTKVFMEKMSMPMTDVYLKQNSSSSRFTLNMSLAKSALVATKLEGNT